MPIINDLNATNASFVLQYGKYTDFNLWITMFFVTLGLMIASRCFPSKDDVGRFLIAALAFVFSIAAIWGSLGIAYIGHAPGATSVITNFNNDPNQTVTYTYEYPTQEVVANSWVTFVCIIVTIFSFINALDIYIVMMQRPDVDENRKTGRGVKYDR